MFNSSMISSVTSRIALRWGSHEELHRPLPRFTFSIGHVRFLDLRTFNRGTDNRGTVKRGQLIGGKLIAWTHT